MSLKPVETLNTDFSPRIRLTIVPIAEKIGCFGGEKQEKFSEIFRTEILHCGILAAAASSTARNSFSAAAWFSIAVTRRSIVNRASAGTVLIFAPSPQSNTPPTLIVGHCFLPSGVTHVRRASFAL